MLTEYLGYSADNLYYVAPKMAREKFIKLVLSDEGGSANWIRQRVSNGANAEALEMLNKNTGKLLVLDSNDRRKIIKIIDL